MFLHGLLCVSVCVCVVWECRQVSQWLAQRNITLPRWCQPCDPGANFIAMEITDSDLWPGPLARDPAGNITHTHRQTHTPVPGQLRKIALQTVSFSLWPAWMCLARLCSSRFGPVTSSVIYANFVEPAKPFDMGDWPWPGQFMLAVDLLVGG